MAPVRSVFGQVLGSNDTMHEIRCTLTYRLPGACQVHAVVLIGVPKDPTVLPADQAPVELRRCQVNDVTIYDQETAGYALAQIRRNCDPVLLQDGAYLLAGTELSAGDTLSFVVDLPADMACHLALCVLLPAVAALGE